MKKILGIGLLALSLFGSDRVLTQNEALKILKATPFYNKIAPKLKQGFKIKGQEKDEFYLITLYDKRGEGNFFITKDLKYTILGNVLDNKTGRMVQPNYPAEPFHGDKNVVKNGIVFTIGHGEKEIYVVTDPECPFCQRFEKLAEEYHLGDKYTIHVIFMPLPFHKHSKDMIYYILSGKNDAEKVKRFKETLRGGKEWQNFKPTFIQKHKIDKIIEKSQKAADELGARGTPSFYDKNMKEIKDRGTIFK